MVFVIELQGSQTFAFEAGNSTDAEALSRSHWFTKALDRFCCKTNGAGNFSKHLRMATEAEASAFRALAHEFADATDNFLVAHLSSGVTIET